MLYHLYFLKADGRIAHVLPVDGADDEEAERCLETHRHAHMIELWDGSRLVGRYEPVEGKVHQKVL
jgi:hypothetical protein